MGDTLQKKFMKIAALALLLLAVFNANNAMALSGSSVTLDSFFKKVWCTATFCEPAYGKTPLISETTIYLERNGYYPNLITVKAGTKIKLNLRSNEAVGCIQAFTIPQLNIQKIISLGNSDIIEFTAPRKPGQLAFMCSMGMYRGVINVI